MGSQLKYSKVYNRKQNEIILLKPQCKVAIDGGHLNDISSLEKQSPVSKIS